MALNESALSELPVALRAGDGVDRVRELAQWALQELIKAEAVERIPHTTNRPGTRDRSPWDRILKVHSRACITCTQIDNCREHRCRSSRRIRRVRPTGDGGHPGRAEPMRVPICPDRCYERRS